MMTLEDFTQGIQECFIDGGVSLNPTTRFRDSDEFDSLVGFTMLVYMEDNFGYRMTVDDYLKCHTAEDLYKKIQDILKKQNG